LDFALNEQQEMMQTLARDFLAGEYPDKVLRATAKDETGFTPELWQRMAATNLLGLSVPEEYGGVGDFLDLAVVLEEMGKVCFISPFFAAVVLGVGIIMEAGSEEQRKQYLPEIVEGKTIVTLALVESSGKYTGDEIQLKAVARDGDYILNGVKMFVPYARVADCIVCAARTDNGITLFMVDKDAPGVTLMPLPVISGEKQYEVAFTDVKASAEDILGEVGDGWRHVEKLLERANAALCAEMVGLAGQALKITLDYAKERVAFGHPIGAFQSVQHRCADMLVDVEGARYVTYQAAWRINEGLPAAREVAIAKAWVGRACRRVMHSAHQIHGAIGFTEDHILHFYTKKAEAAASSFGGVDAQLEKI
jgi:alkylation response protein AidB-like acyl-CoA dehydrogenase